MHRVDDSRYLLFIEPDKNTKALTPIDDEWTEMVEKALKYAKRGSSLYDVKSDTGTFTCGSTYKGFHITDCGNTSDNSDYLLPNLMITNSLAAFYVRWYRHVIPLTEIKKIKSLMRFMRDYNGERFSSEIICPNVRAKLNKEFGG